MKKHQFIYTLSFLILTLFAFAMLADSQESTEQITEESNLTEQSPTDQLPEESNPTEQPSEELNPPESQFNTLKENIKTLESNFSTLKDSSENSFQIFVIIFAAFVILISAFVIFWGRHLDRQWQRKFNNGEQNGGRISQQSEANTQKLEKIEPNQSLISNELRPFQNTIAGIESRLDNLEPTVTSLESDRENELEKFQNIIVGIESRLDNLEPTVTSLESDKETNITPDNTVVYQVDVKSTIFETQSRLEELVRAYRDGEPIDLDYIETPIPSHNVVLNLNWIAHAITEWITELEQSTEGNQDLIQTLRYAEQTMKNKLKTIREEFMPALKQLNLETNMELGDIRDQSIIYPAQLKGILIGYELGRKVDEAGSDRIVSQFIKDQLFNNVARHIPHDQLQEKLDRFLQLADYEVIPIEVGVTEADRRVHEVLGSKQTSVKRGTVAEVITPGLMLKSNYSIVQKPVVIRGE